MVRAYVYEAPEAGLEAWPAQWGLLRFDGAELTRDPEAADLFVFPPPLHQFREPSQLRALPHMGRYEIKHVFFDISDGKHVYGLKCFFMRTSLTQTMLRSDPNSVSWPWPVDDLSHLAPPPGPGERFFACSFHGWVNYEPRQDSTRSCLEILGDDFDRRLYPKFYGTVYAESPEEAKAMREGFLTSLHRSKVILAPRSVPGNFPYRFVEALSAARMPLLFCDDGTLPWEGDIDWQKCALLYPEREARNAGKIVKDFLEKTGEAEYLERTRYGRAVWERYLDPRKWPALMLEAAVKHLRRLGLSCS